MGKFAIVVTFVASFGLGITGTVLLVESTASYVEHDQGLRSMIAGCVLLTLAVFLLIAAAVMGFISSARK